MSETADPISEAIQRAVDELRRAVLEARDRPASPDLAESLADSLEWTAEGLRDVARRARPVEVRVAGVFYALGDPPKLDLRVGDPITLQREPDNRHDPDAVAALAFCGTRIGYLPRTTAADLAPHIDRGLAASATVTEARRTDIAIAIHGSAVDALRSSAESRRALVL